MSLPRKRVRWLLLFGPLIVFALCYGYACFLNMRAVKLAERMFLEEEQRFDNGVGTIDALDAASIQIVRASEAMIWPLGDRQAALQDHVNRLRQTETQLIALQRGILRDQAESETLAQTIQYRQKAEEMLLQYQKQVQ